MKSQNITRAITDFINEIEVPVDYSPLSTDTFLPGILIHQGRLIIDQEKLKYPGDLLHEAGHIAVTPSAKRGELSGDVHKCGHGPAEEMATIAWSWAALMKIGLAAEVLFHPDGYRGGSENYIDAFSNSSGFGHPLLSYWGLCQPEQQPDGYPIMEKWLRDY
jgi:hypothetical protein